MCSNDSIYLSIHGLSDYVRAWQLKAKAITRIAILLSIVLVIGSAALAQRIMAHEVRMDQLDALLHRLDEIYRHHEYAIFIPWTYVDFHFLRFVYPHKKVYAVYALSKKRIHRNAQWWSEFERRAYGPRAVQSLDELLALDQSDSVYLGFDENFPIANLRETLDKFAWQSLSRWLNEKLDSMDPLNHLTTSWMWCHPALTFTELARSGHYFAFRISR